MEKIKPGQVWCVSGNDLMCKKYYIVLGKENKYLWNTIRLCDKKIIELSFASLFVIYTLIE